MSPFLYNVWKGVHKKPCVGIFHRGHRGTHGHRFLYFLQGESYSKTIVTENQTVLKLWLKKDIATIIVCCGVRSMDVN